MEKSLQRKQASSLTTDERIIKAQEQQLIRYATDHDISVTLVWIFNLIGLKEFPDKTQKLVLLNYIKNHFANFTLDEIKIAYEIGIKGGLNIDMKHFQIFSPMYLETVMQAYRKKRFDIIENNKQDPEIDKKEEEKKDKEAIIRSLKKAYQEYIETGKISYLENGIITMVLLWYDLLDKKIINLTKEEKLAYMDRGKKEWKKYLEAEKLKTANFTDKIQYNHLKQFLIKFTENSQKKDFQETIIRYAKIEIIKDLFEKMKNEGQKEFVI